MRISIYLPNQEPQDLNQHLSRNFCLWDTSAQGYVPDPPSLFSRTGGSGDETS